MNAKINNVLLQVQQLFNHHINYTNLISEDVKKQSELGQELPKLSLQALIPTQKFSMEEKHNIQQLCTFMPIIQNQTDFETIIKILIMGNREARKQYAIGISKNILLNSLSPYTENTRNIQIVNNKLQSLKERCQAYWLALDRAQYLYTKLIERGVNPAPSCLYIMPVEETHTYTDWEGTQGHFCHINSSYDMPTWAGDIPGSYWNDCGRSGYPRLLHQIFPENEIRTPQEELSLALTLERTEPQAHNEIVINSELITLESWQRPFCWNVAHEWVTSVEKSCFPDKTQYLYRYTKDGRLIIN